MSWLSTCFHINFACDRGDPIGRRGLITMQNEGTESTDSMAGQIIDPHSPSRSPPMLWWWGRVSKRWRRWIWSNLYSLSIYFYVAINLCRLIGSPPIISRVDPEVGRQSRHCGRVICVICASVKAQELKLTTSPSSLLPIAPFLKCTMPLDKSDYLRIWAWHHGGSLTCLLFLLWHRCKCKITSKDEEEAERYNVDADASPPSSLSSPLYLLFFIIVNVQIDIDKTYHHIIITDHHHNNHSRQSSINTIKSFLFIVFISFMHMLYV